jgi:hypothetical protein
VDLGLGMDITPLEDWAMSPKLSSTDNWRQHPNGIM